MTSRIIKAVPIRRARPLNPRQKKQVKRLIGVREEKKIFGAGDFPSVSSSGSIVSLSDVAQGDTYQTRDGDNLRLSKVNFNYKCLASAGGLFASSDDYNTVRVILFRWNVNSGATNPTVAHILTNQGSSTDLTIAPYTLNQDSAFHIVYDKTHLLYNTPVYDGTNLDTKAGPGHLAIAKKVFYGRKLGAKDIKYVNNTTSGFGKLYMLLVSDSAYLPSPSVNWQVQILFTDS